MVTQGKGRKQEPDQQEGTWGISDGAIMLHGAGSAATAIDSLFAANKEKEWGTAAYTQYNKGRRDENHTLLMMTGETVGNQYAAYAGPFFLHTRKGKDGTNDTAVGTYAKGK